jgi:alpha-ribazole phosphatase
MQTTRPRRWKCLLIQHGSTTRGSDDRFCGFTDPPLSSTGRQLVLNLRERLQREGVRLPGTWYVSDRRRTVETFEIMTAGLPAPVVRLSEKLREINFGEFENLTWQELPVEFQRRYEASMTDPFDLKFPQGESFRDLCERVSSLALEILSWVEHEGDIGIVGHQGSMRLWVMMAEGLPPSAFFSERMQHGEARWIEIGADQVAQWRQKYLSRLPHAS